VDEGLYSQEELSSVPEISLGLSRGCGNPTGFAGLCPGEVVVDLGCGGGIDVVLAAREVGPHGRVVGMDLAPQMIERATQAVNEAGLGETVQLRAADIERPELAHGLADVVISNCVINLCPDKAAVYREAFRILRPGGRLAISDIVLTEKMSPELQERFRSTWSGCLGGCVSEGEYLDIIDEVGFVDRRIVTRHVLTPEELEAMTRCPGEEFAPPPAMEDVARVQDTVVSIKFTAAKPLIT